MKYVCALPAVLVLIAAMQSPARAADPKPRTKIDHSSPKAVAQSFKKAMSKKDWAGGVRCMDPESQEAFATMMALVAGLTAAFDKDKTKKTTLEKLMKKHGLKEGGGKEALKNVKDRPALVVDLLAWIEKNVPRDKNGKGPGSMAEQIGKTTFSDFKITGDRATAEVVRGDKKQDRADFRKIKGKWYVDFATSMKRLRKKAPRKR